MKHVYANRLLKTENGKNLRIISPGVLNSDSGPDFLHARIELDGQLWIGNVEIHIRSSDWLKHGHATDRAYCNVILHVVLVNDADIKDSGGNSIPVLVLTEELLDAAVDYSKSNPLMPVVSPGALELFGAARLARKTKALETELMYLKGDVEELFKRHLFRRFGMGVNSEPFQQLAHVLHASVIRRQRSNLADLEALLFGQSGLLPAIPTDGYSADLLYRYLHLKNKYSLTPLQPAIWKYMRMRPSNFPTIRISQLAALLHGGSGPGFRKITDDALRVKGPRKPSEPKHVSDHLFSYMIMQETSFKELSQLLEIKASEYWNNHFRFGITSHGHPKYLGQDAVASILINTVAVMRFFVGKLRDDQPLQESAILLLRELPPENNKIIRASGLAPQNALESQGAMELASFSQPGTDTDADADIYKESGRKFSDEDNLSEPEQDPPGCSEPLIPYFSTRNHHDGKSANRQNSGVVRNQGVWRVRLVG